MRRKIFIEDLNKNIQETKQLVNQVNGAIDAKRNVKE